MFRVPPLQMLARSAASVLSHARPQLTICRALSQPPGQHVVPHPPTPPTPPAALQRAIDAVIAIPEVGQAASTSDATQAQQLLSRTLDIVARAHPVSSSSSNSSSYSPPDVHAAVAHTLLAHHNRRVGDVAAERRHRIAALPSISTEFPAAHLGLSLCCLRVPGGESRLAAAAASADAHAAATDHVERITASLLTALVADPAPRRLLLSALTAADAPVLNHPGPDIGGLARYALARDALRLYVTSDNSDHDGKTELSTALDHAKALVVRWDGRAFEFVEALILAAQLSHVTHGKEGLAAADDFLTRALKEAERQGVAPADKAEPLLALAQMAKTRGAMIEAEGLFRAFDDAMANLWRRRAFTVAAADVFVRGMTSYSQFLREYTVNGVPRSTEADDMAERARVVREMFPQILAVEEQPIVDLWVIEWLAPYFDLQLPV